MLVAFEKWTRSPLESQDISSTQLGMMVGCTTLAREIRCSSTGAGFFVKIFSSFWQWKPRICHETIHIGAEGSISRWGVARYPLGCLERQERAPAPPAWSLPSKQLLSRSLEFGWMLLFSLVLFLTLIRFAWCDSLEFLSEPVQFRAQALHSISCWCQVVQVHLCAGSHCNLQ